MPGKTVVETTKDLVERMKADAKKHQGHAETAFLRKYMKDPNGLGTLNRYKAQFEVNVKIPEQQNAHYRIRSNFALMNAAAWLAIDYGILPWDKRATFRAIRKCMRAALAILKAGEPTFARSAVQLAAHLKNRIEASTLVSVTPKQRSTPEQKRKRQKADGLVIDGEILLKPDRLRAWFPSSADLAALTTFLKDRAVLRTTRDDTPTCEQLIGGIPGKPRYYVLKTKALKALPRVI
jgi:hypothetical protein